MLRRPNFLIFMFALLACAGCKKPAKIALPPAADPDYQKAKAYLYHQNDSAFLYFNKVSSRVKDSLETARSYTYMALIQSDAGDYFGAQESLIQSLRFLNPSKIKDQQCLSSAYNELGVTSLNLKNYDAALGFFEQAISFAQQEKFKQIFLNNKALAYQDKGDYTHALELYRVIIAHTTEKETYARVQANLATTKWLARPSYNAAPELLKALSIRVKENDRWGENASYAHLSDFYARSRPDSGFFYAIKMYATATALHSPDDRLEALQKMIRGSSGDTKAYFLRYQVLSDSLQTARNAAKNQFALIRYEVEKNKADNLKLQKDNTEKRYQLDRQNVLITGILLLLFATAGSGWAWHKYRIRKDQLRISKKVHDEVANGVYQIITEVEHKAIAKEGLLDKLEKVYERSRDISYEGQVSGDRDFHTLISALLTSFATGHTRVLLVGNSAALWEKVSAKARQELEVVLQELMVNMTKHSGAKTVVVRFEQRDREIGIEYLDDGRGLPPDHRPGNGMRNTGNRIKAIRGRINFEVNGDKGLLVRIAFPIA